MAFLLATLAALCNALTSTLQRVAARKAPPDSSFRLKLIAYLVHRPVWFLGMFFLIGGFLLQAGALYYGQLSQVQPVLVSELVFTLVIIFVWFRSRIPLRDWLGALAICIGLAGFLVVADPTPGHQTPGFWHWVGAGAAVVAVVLCALGIAQRGSPARRAALYGTAAALIWAFTAALIKTMTNVIQTGWGQLFVHWPVYAVAVTGIAGLFIVENAFQAGPLTASQPALTIVDPIASILLGVWLFGDRLRGGLGPEILTLLVMAAGVVLLGRSPLITGSGPDGKGSGRPGANRAEDPV